MASTQPIKARRILSIVDSLKKSDAHGLMDIPSELRATIWTLVLNEPDLLDRKHAITCPLGDRNADYVTPPAVMRCIDRSATWGYGIPPPLSRAEERCLRTCVRRKSLALLRISRQIHREAMDVWAVHASFFSSSSVTYAMSKANQAAQLRIHRLTVCDYLPFSSVRLYDGREEHFDTLAKLENLQQIEISPNAIKGGPYWIIKLVQMPKLKRIVFSMPPEEAFARQRYSSQAWLSGRMFFALISKAIEVDEMVPCAHGICSSGTKSGKEQRVTSAYWCSECQANLEEIRQAARNLESLADPAWKRSLQRRNMPDLSTIFTRLQKEAPTHSREYPIIGSLVVEGHAYRTTIYGVPEDSPDVRHRRETDMRIANIPVRDRETKTGDASERLSKADRLVPVKVEAVEPYTKAFGRLHTKVEVRRDEIAQLSAAETRNGRNANTEIRERKEQRLAAKADAARHERLVMQADDERRAARKRVQSST